MVPAGRRGVALRAWVVARTLFLDDLLAGATRQGCRQVVLLGAGLRRPGLPAALAAGHPLLRGGHPGRARPQGRGARRGARRARLRARGGALRPAR